MSAMGIADHFMGESFRAHTPDQQDEDLQNANLIYKLFKSLFYFV
jgi:hypothetical protein